MTADNAHIHSRHIHANAHSTFVALREKNFGEFNYCPTMTIASMININSALEIEKTTQADSINYVRTRFLIC